jgi:hypothetical protein
MAISNLATAASPQVAASQALLRDATRLRKTLEATCSNPAVGRTSFQLESAACLLAEKIERQRCESEVSPLMYECIELYNRLVVYVERDYHLASSPQVVKAMQCTAAQLNKTADALRQYRSHPIPHASPTIPRPTWSTGRPPMSPYSLGQPPVDLPAYGDPMSRPHFEPDHAPIQINRSGGYQNYPEAHSQYGNQNRELSFHRSHNGDRLHAQPQSSPSQPPKIGQMILDRVLREALR